ncbi:hypothetical protein DY000_02052928 [Brassica cretica]|uniref:Uncharacterized protein n=1 Tax=Brassica cretica TaxID=69181 RepID=A0ABQ7ABE0_BRACR|nr:hypothetical protein DY000_02052928 [Brassica cretica]
MGITSATRCGLTSYQWHWKANRKIYIVSKDGLNLTALPWEYRSQDARIFKHVSGSADSRACRVFDPARQSAELDWFSSANGRAGRVFDPAWPSTELDWFSLVDGRAGRVVDPARPSTELDWFSLADGRAGRVVDPAQPSAEQVAWSIQLGGWQNRLNQTMGRSSSIANHLICQCSSAPQKVQTNELDCLFGSVIHFSRVFCSGTFVERQDLGLITALGGAMTSSTYVSRIVFDLISSRFKVRDMFSAYVTCLSKDQEDVGSRLKQEEIIPKPATSNPLKLEDVSVQAHEEQITYEEKEGGLKERWQGRSIGCTNQASKSENPYGGRSYGFSKLEVPLPVQLRVSALRGGFQPNHEAAFFIINHGLQSYRWKPGDHIRHPEDTSHNPGEPYMISPFTIHQQT